MSQACCFIFGAAGRRSILFSHVVRFPPHGVNFVFSTFTPFHDDDPLPRPAARTGGGARAQFSPRQIASVHAAAGQRFVTLKRAANDPAPVHPVHSDCIQMMISKMVQILWFPFLLERGNTERQLPPSARFSGGRRTEVVIMMIQVVFKSA